MEYERFGRLCAKLQAVHGSHNQAVSSHVQHMGCVQ